MNSELSLSQLISSRICHDLVGAAGAVSAGVELLNEDPTEMAAPLGLMATSAEQLTRRLAFFRVAFGSAGGPDSPYEAAQLRKLLEDYVADKKLNLVWDSLNIDNAVPASKSACGKLLSVMVMIAIDCLPRGGDARIHVAPIDGGMAVAIEASGNAVRFPDDINIAIHLQQVTDQLSARNVHAYVAAQLAKSINGSLQVEVGDGVVQIACLVSDYQ